MNRISSIAAAAALTAATLVAAPASADDRAGLPVDCPAGEPFCEPVETCPESDPAVQKWINAYAAEHDRATGLEAKVAQLEAKVIEDRDRINADAVKLANAEAKIGYLRGMVQILRDKLRAK